MKKGLCLSLVFLGVAILLSFSISINGSHAADSPKISIAYSVFVRQGHQSSICYGPRQHGSGVHDVSVVDWRLQ
jgi:hypothetical protein